MTQAGIYYYYTSSRDRGRKRFSVHYYMFYKWFYGPPSSYPNLLLWFIASFMGDEDIRSFVFHTLPLSCIIYPRRVQRQRHFEMIGCAVVPI